MSLLGKLVNNTIDIAAADFTITAARSEAVDFLPVLIESFIQAFIANPEGRQNWMAFVEPVTWQAWLGIFTFLLLAPPIICCVFFYGTKSDAANIYNIVVLILEMLCVLRTIIYFS